MMTEKEHSHYKTNAKNSKVHSGYESYYRPGYFISDCNGRAQTGEKTDEPVTCTRCRYGIAKHGFRF
jgi:hypothetical protein